MQNLSERSLPEKALEMVNGLLGLMVVVLNIPAVHSHVSERRKGPVPVLSPLRSSINRMYVPIQHALSVVPRKRP